MHMMFVDESGDTGYPSNGKWANFRATKYYARVGLIIHGMALEDLESSPSSF
jgi:hypothetical protein